MTDKEAKGVWAGSTVYLGSAPQTVIARDGAVLFTRSEIPGRTAFAGNISMYRLTPKEGLEGELEDARESLLGLSENLLRHQKTVLGLEKMVEAGEAEVNRLVELLAKEGRE